MNCKPGDLAIVVRGLKGNSTQIGKIVRVVGAYMNHPKLGQIWVIEFARPIPIFSHKSNLKALGGSGESTLCHCADDWLRPLKGDEVSPEENIVRELEPA